MEFIQQIFSALIGLCMVAALIGFMLKRDAIDWESLHNVYGDDWKPPIRQKLAGNMLLYSQGRPAKSYHTGMKIGIYENGIGLRPLGFYAMFQRPVFVPFSDIKGWQQKWYLNSKSIELAFRKTPHMRLIMPTEYVDWIAANSKGDVVISDNFPSHGNWPWLTYVNAILGILMVITVIAIMILNPDFKTYLENYKRH